MKVYKGTDKDMKCRGFQYKLGEASVFDGEPHLCMAGLHACKQPIDVLNYYAPSESRYFEADAVGVSDERESDDSKIVAKKMTLKAEIGIPGLVKAQVEYIKKQIGFDDAIKRADAEKENHATGNWGAASATGYPVLLLQPDMSVKQWALLAAQSAASSAANGTERHIRLLPSKRQLSTARRSRLIPGIS